MADDTVPELKGRAGQFGTESDGKPDRQYRQRPRFHVVSSPGGFLGDMVIGVRIARFLATKLPRLFNVEETNVALPDAN